MTSVLFALDEPQYHRFRLGETQRFRGAALAYVGAAIESLRVVQSGRTIGETRVDLPCPELAFLGLPNAANSRFAFDLRVDDSAPVELRGVDVDGGESTLFGYDVPFAHEQRERLRALTEGVEALPVPDGDIIAITQGGRDARSYLDSMISGHVSLEQFLRHAGVDPEALTSILDIGCGTGRLLTGWHASGRKRRLVGGDINDILIGWCNQHLPHVAEWSVTPSLPPLAYDDQSFDLVILASVFTHLPLDWQRAWIRELQRLVSPGGAVVLTLHGTPYHHLLLDVTQRAMFDREGYVERRAGDPGANSFGTFHSPAFAEELVRPFEVLRRYPSGVGASGVASWFPIAAWQDVYVLRR